MLSTKQNTDVSFWDKRRSVLRDRKGGWLPGKGVYTQGHDMMNDLVGKISYFQLIILSVTGQLPDERLAKWLEASFMCVSWPDPRIWCNHIGSLGGDSKTSATAASIAGILAGDSVMYGQGPVLAGAQFIQGALADYKAGMTTEQIVQREINYHRGKVKITGYARPLATGDERVVALERYMEELDLAVGEHLSLGYRIDDFLQENYREGMNINGLLTAFMSDQGYTPEQIYQICALCVANGVTSCYIEEYHRKPGSFLPLRCNDVNYTGPALRKVPKKE